MHTGQVIKQLRERAGMTQTELGKILGVNKSTIQKYENGMVQNLKIRTIRTLCETFVVPSWHFIYPEKSSFEDEETAMTKLRQTLLLAKIYDQLTEEGQKRIYLYLKDISEISHYKKEMPMGTIENDIQHLKDMLIKTQIPYAQKKKNPKKSTSNAARALLQEWGEP